jgi:hypothetical protein
MSEQELKKSVEAMQNLRTDLTSSKGKALAFLVKAGIVTTSGTLRALHRAGCIDFPHPYVLEYTDVIFHPSDHGYATIVYY